MKWVKNEELIMKTSLCIMFNVRFVLLFLMKQSDEKEINVQTLYVIETLQRTI